MTTPSSAVTNSYPPTMSSPEGLVNSSVSSLPEDFKSAIVFYAVFTPVFTVGLIGNSLLILIFARHKTMRTSPNTYIFNLALADLLSILSCTLAPLLDNVEHSHPLFCKTFQIILESSMGVSAFTLTALSAERYYVIARPLQNNSSSRKFTVYVVAFIWFVSISFFISKYILMTPTNSAGCVHMFDPRTFAHTYTLIDFLVLYLVPIAIITDFYILMAYELYFGNRSLRNENISNHVDQLHARKKIAKTVLILVVMYAVGYFPFCFMSLKLYFDSKFATVQTWSIATNIIFCVSCIPNCLNPVVLFFQSKSFKNYFSKYLCFFIIRSPVSVENEHNDYQCTKCSNSKMSETTV